MFGSTNNPFVGQSFGSPFGSHSSNAAANNGFGSQTGSSTILGGNSSTGVFGVTTSSSYYGSSSTPSIPVSGGSSSSWFGGFGEKKPVFWSPTQTSPLGSSTTQPSEPVFGIGSTSTTMFDSSTPAATSPTTFGTGSSGTAFGVSNALLFGSGGAFGGASSTPAFAAFMGASSSSPSLSFASTAPAFGQSSSTLRSCMFGAHESTTPTIAFGSFGGGQHGGGSRGTCYAPTTPEPDNGGAVAVGKLVSISAMPVYRHKSHEELRWDDYRLGDKGGAVPVDKSHEEERWDDYQLRDKGAASSSSRINFPSPTLTLGQTSTSTLFSNLNAPKQQPPGSFTTSLQFPPSTSSPSSSFAQSVITATPVQGSSPAFKFNSSIFSPSSTTSIGPLALPLNAAQSSSSTKQSNFLSAPSPTLAGQTSSTQFSNLYAPKTQRGCFTSGCFTNGSFTTSVEFPPSSSPSTFVSSSSPSLIAQSIGPTTISLFNPSATSIGQTTSAFGPTTTSSFVPSKIFHNHDPSTGFVNMFSGTPSVSTNMFSSTPSLSTSSPAQSPIFGENNFEQLSATRSSAVIQPDPTPVATNPFGTLPEMPRMSMNGRGVQYGISSMPVLGKPASVRISSPSLLTSRLHLSQRRFRWSPASKYHPKNDGPKIPFFSDVDEETDNIPKALVICPRDNPRSFVTCQLKSTFDKASPIKDTTCTPMEENGNSFEGAPAIVVYEHGAADIDALMPKLRPGSDYYTEPGIEELAIKETSSRGFCCHVKDFVIGRHGYGSIKFLGETDVRRLDIESLVQFNNREVIVYMDDSKKPPVRQGLNKPAEVTLLNIKCFDKKTGNQHTQGPKIEKYMQMLKRKAEEQDAEYVSYDPVKGEWKFRVNHF